MEETAVGRDLGSGDQYRQESKGEISAERKGKKATGVKSD
jgi:hypothetical protein